MCAAFLLSCFSVQAIVVDSVGTISPALSGTEVYYACVVYHQNGGSKDVNFMLMDGSIADEEITWAGSEILVNFGANGLYAYGNEVPADTLSFDDGDEVHIWIAVNVPAKTYDVYAMNYTQDSGQKTVVTGAAFRVNQATSLGKWAAVHNENASGNTLEVKAVATVADRNSYPASYDAVTTLQSLSVGTGTLTPAFDPEVTEYSVVLPKENEGASVEVTAKATVPNATVSGAGTIALTNGSATASVTVTSAGGQTKTYNINISTLAKSNDATLKSITVTLGTDSQPLSGFTPDALDYTFSVPADFTGVPTVSAEANSKYAGTPVITQATNVPGTATIAVTAEDGTQLTYTVKFIINLLAGWDGNGATGTNSSPENFGWHTTTGNAFNTANGNGGARYMDPGNGEYSGYKFNGEDYCSTRALWLRWGLNVATGVYTYDMDNLQGCTTYQFTWKQAWHNNANQPEVKVGVYTKSDSTLIREITLGCAEKREWVEGTLVFTTPETDDDFYLAFVATIAGKTAWGDVIIAFTDLQMEEYTGAPILDVSKDFQFFTDYTEESMKNIHIDAIALTEDLSITAPAGISLSVAGKTGSSITLKPDEITCGGSLEMSVSTDSETSMEGEIIISTGSMADTVDVKYMTQEGENLISLAMGAGSEYTSTDFTPNYFGWQGMTLSNEWFAEAKENKVATWTESGVWGNRYDSVAGFVYDNDTIDSWTLILRWDGTGNTDSATVFSYPVEIEEPGIYTFTGKHAWHSTSAQCLTSVGINTQRDNAPSTAIAPATLIAEYYDFEQNGKRWTDMRLDFEVAEAGTYYLTFMAAPLPDYLNYSSQCIIALKDLQIVTEGKVAVQVPQQDNVKVFVQDRYIKVDGTEDYRIYSVSGAEVNPQARQLQGVYIVVAGAAQYKVLVK